MVKLFIPTVIAVLLVAGCSSLSITPPTVPGVIGMTGREAREMLTEAEYEVELEAADGSPIFMESEWTVDSQSPAAGSELDQGGLVTVTVSKQTPS